MNPRAGQIAFTPAGTISSTNVQDAIEEVAAEAGGGGGSTSLHPVEARKTDGSTLVNNGSWTVYDTALDLVVPAAAGDLIEYGISSIWDANAPEGYIDVATMVSGSPYSYFATGSPTASTRGVSAWFGASSAATALTGSAVLTLVSGDIVSGNVTLRLFTKTTGAKTLYSETNLPMQVWAKNLGQ